MSLEFRAVSHRYDAVPVLSDVSFEARAGRITCLLGASGCGKTTLMKLAAGILPLQAGAVMLGDETLADSAFSPPPEQRPVGVVFQEGALFAHMTVRANIAFGLRGMREKDSIINTLLEQVGLSNFADRYPHMLSGGQQQRVALARALAPAPRVMLLDEPFANIDILLRRGLRLQTRAMLKDSARVVMLVTHDPEEALEMADEIVVLSEGTVLQAGPPQSLYDAPASLAVAALISEAQALSGRYKDGALETPFGAWPAEVLRAPRPDHAELDLAIRAHDVRLKSSEAGSATVTDYRMLRGQYSYAIEANGERLIALTPEPQGVNPGDSVQCVPRANSVFAFPKVTSTVA
ncbi:MAG: ABC transporter ATP-binding protein [Pseudomonadota bacterium]